jgi:uncharacterized lipoprotein YajG
MKTLKLTLAMALLLLSGCAYSVHQVQVSDFTPYAALEKGDVVRGSGEQFAVMGFVTETNYIDEAYQSLQAKCVDGELSGITTQLSTSLGFFSWTNKALMQGLCTKN